VSRYQKKHFYSVTHTRHNIFNARQFAAVSGICLAQLPSLTIFFYNLKSAVFTVVHENTTVLFICFICLSFIYIIVAVYMI